MQLENIKILGLSGASELTKGVCKILDIKPIDVTISHFADGEILVRPEEPVRHSNIIIILPPQTVYLCSLYASPKCHISAFQYRL